MMKMGDMVEREMMEEVGVRGEEVKLVYWWDKGGEEGEQVELVLR